MSEGRGIELVETLEKWGAAKDQEGVTWLTVNGYPVLDLTTSFQNAVQSPAEQIESVLQRIATELDRRAEGVESDMDEMPFPESAIRQTRAKVYRESASLLRSHTEGSGDGLTDEERKAARIALEATYNMEADDEPNPNAATRAWRKLREPDHPVHTEGEYEPDDVADFKASDPTRIVSVAEHEEREASRPEWHPTRCPTCGSDDPAICCRSHQPKDRPHKWYAHVVAECCPDDWHNSPREGEEHG